MRRSLLTSVSLSLGIATLICLLSAYAATPARAASVTVSVDFATPVDYPLSKTKFGLYNSCITPISRYNRDINLINELHTASLRIDGAIGPGIGSPSYNAANGTACASPEGSGIAPAPVTGTIGNIQYDFSQLDQFATLLNQRNVLPVLSYSYEPWPLQNNGAWKSPPTDPNAWQGVLQTVAGHFRQTGNAIGYHEIYNEPNITNFFDGSETDYLNMYQYGAAGLRAGDPDALVAGPALSNSNAVSDPFSYLQTYLNYVSQHQLPSDVISVHQYPSDDTSEPSSVDSFLGSVKSVLAGMPYFNTNDLDLNEYNTFHISYQQGGIQDTYLAASRFLNDLSYFLSQPYLTQVNWTSFQDIVSAATGQHPGLVSFDGHRKAIYNAYKIYADMPVDRRQVTITGSTGVTGLASTDSHKAGLVLWNLSGADQALSVAFNNIPFPTGTLRVFPIDANHASWGDNPANEFLLPTEIRPNVNTAGLQWSGTLPNNGVVYLEVDDGTGLSDLQPNPVAKVIRTWHYYNNRNTTAYADFDKNTWIARLGMAAEQWQDEEIGVTAEQLPATLNVQSQVDGTLTHEDVNSCACFRIDYADNTGAYTWGVLFHGPYNGGTDLYDPNRNVGLPWGTTRKADQVVPVSNLAAFAFNPSAYAPPNWSGRATITFSLQNAGVGTRLKMSLQGGLAGHWAFDDGSGQTAADTSGQGNNGAVNGATWTQGVINKALSFNGTSNYVSMGNPGALNFGAGSFSVAAWFKTTATGFNRIVSKGDYGWTPGYWMSVGHGGDGHVATGLGGGSQANSVLFWTTNGGFNDGRWHHAVAVYDRAAGTAQLYVDGVAQSVTVAGSTCGATMGTGTTVNISACTSATATGQDPFDVGSHDGTAEFFNGSIDDVRAYNRALTLQDVRYLAGPGSGATGQWKFDEGSGINTADASGNNDHGVISGASWTPGKYGQALSFNGTNNYVSMGNPGALNFGTNSFSVAAWFKTTATGLNRIVSKGDSGWTPGYWLSVGHGGDGRVATGLGGGSQANSILFWTTNTFNDGQWHHAVAVYDRTAGTATLYVDGVAQSVTVAGGTCGTATGTAVNIANCGSATATTGNDLFDVGSHNGMAEFFNGSIDDVRAYNRALTPQQIGDIVAGNG